MPNGFRPGPFGPFGPGPQHPIRDRMFLQNLCQQMRQDAQQLMQTIEQWSQLEMPTDQQIQNIENDAQQLAHLVGR